MYLAFIQNHSNQSMKIKQTIKPIDRCPNITELFNQTFIQWHLIRRIKYYHLPCQNLSCFHDDVHLCLCYQFGQKRLANCFKFNHEMSFNCYGQSECENNGQCFQDHIDCPQRSICLCQPCYYGRRCELNTNGYSLSLDGILGYHIHSNRNLNQQPFIIKISLILTIMFMCIGLINSILSIITFKNKIICEVGCGIYLLTLSIITLLIILIFGLRFSILLLIQMTIISNRTFLLIQCHFFEFILRICLCLVQWFNVCIAIERTITVLQKTRFNKKKSKQTAKYIICILIIFTILTCIHDGIYRRLIIEENDDDDDDDNNNKKHIWCVNNYGNNLQIYDFIIHTFHLCIPFLINIISPIILIISKSNQQRIIQNSRLYIDIFYEQFQLYKNLIIAPIVLVILALPRLIIIFLFKCMQSTNDVWLYLIGYFISFIPSMLTFIIFILPSKFYKEEFTKSIQHYRAAIKRLKPM